MDFVTEVTEELLGRIKCRYYRGDKEVKIGDKIIWGFTSEKISDEEITLNMKCFVLDGMFIYELKEQK